MAGHPVKDEARHRVKPEPGADKRLSSGGSSSHIEQLISRSSVLELEAGVQAGLRLLETLKTTLKASHGAGSPEGAQWLQDIQQVEEKAKPARTVIGVVGVTGAGKSSVINAVLDEERLVPTSGIRACTASATEISYNHSDDPDELYRAEVEFITADEWSRELSRLLEDLVDGTGNVSQDCNSPESEAGLAYSKIKAVYPHMKKDEIRRCASDPSALAQEPLVRAVLGSVKRLRATSSPDLYEGLQKYIDSKEIDSKETGSKETGSKEKKSPQMEYWPLIKVVRIYCKAAALSTGVVLVDLPGVQDSNAARAAVAEKYIKVCNGLWITADIQRAISQQAAQKLLGESFKRQLKYDGAFSAVTFVCTKVDDILTAEVKKSLEIEDEVGDYWEQIELLGRRRDRLTGEIEDLKEQKKCSEEQFDDFDKSLDAWGRLQDKLAKGQPVYRPSENTKKRKRKTSLGRRRNTRGPVNDPSDSDDKDSSDDAGDQWDTQTPQAQQVPLTEEDIEDEMASVKALKKEARKSKKSLTKALEKAEMDLAQVNDDDALTKSEMRSVCIRGRSKYLKDCIKRDFAMGIKELDQELAIEEDEATFDPDQEARDYDEVARSLPVFCVSSRAYQKLAGRLEKDAVQIDGFATLDDTEIPLLQEHARRLTEAGRISTSRLFLNELSQLLNSLRLWAAVTAPRAVSRKGQKVGREVLRARLARLKNDLRRCVKDCHSLMQHDIQEQLYKSFDRLIPVASGSAVETAIGWGKSRSDSGMFWGSYKATCRRDGSWSGRNGARDLNAELFEPLNKKLAGRWERTFQRRIPSALAECTEACNVILEEFHRDVAANVPGAAENLAALQMLTQQKRTHQVLLGLMPTFIGAKITESQREASRGFTPVIQDAMQPGYDACARERGPGTFGRMKAIMEAHVVTARNTMFRQACDAVKAQLDAMCADVEHSMAAFIQDLFTKLRRDYLATLSGGHAEATNAVPSAERILRDQVRPILEDCDVRFAFAGFCLPAAGGGPAGLEQDDNDLIARQLEDVSESETQPPAGMKPEPL